MDPLRKWAKLSVVLDGTRNVPTLHTAQTSSENDITGFYFLRLKINFPSSDKKHSHDMLMQIDGLLLRLGSSILCHYEGL